MGNGNRRENLVVAAADKFIILLSRRARARRCLILPQLLSLSLSVFKGEGCEKKRGREGSRARGKRNFILESFHKFRKRGQEAAELRSRELRLYCFRGRPRV